MPEDKFELVGFPFGKNLPILICPYCGFHAQHLHGVNTGEKMRGSYITIYISCEGCSKYYDLTLHFHKGEIYIQTKTSKTIRPEMWRD